MRYLLSRALVALFFLSQAGWASATETPARAVVEALHESLIATMKEGGVSPFDTRSDRLAPVIAETFDMSLIARVSLGRHWQNISAEQREKVTEALERLTTATYAGRFDNYSGEEFKVLSEEPAPRGTVFVKSELIKSDGEAVSINYLLRSTDEGWRIVDVYLDAKYSELAVRRSEYASIIKRVGFDGLMSEIEKKIASYNTTGSVK